MSIHVFFVSLRKITKKRKYIMELIYLLYLIIGIALGALAVFFAMRSQVQAARERSTSTEQQMREQQETFRQQMQAMQEAQQQQMRDGRESLQQQLRSQQESQQQQMAQQMALLRQMRSQTEKMQKDHNDSLLQLKAAIQVNMERERAMGEQTERLAQALTGQNKIQGNFGELKLTQILEQMELERGLQYDTQETMRDEQGRTITSDEGRRSRPS